MINKKVHFTNILPIETTVLDRADQLTQVEYDKYELNCSDDLLNSFDDNLSQLQSLIDQVVCLNAEVHNLIK